MNFFRIGHTRLSALMMSLFLSSVAVAPAIGAPAIDVLGKDFTFPNAIGGLPAKLSEFPGLQINRFETSDGVKLAYWEAGSGRPIVFIPGWSANGGEYFNVLYLLSKRYHVYVLDPRNQGLSETVDYGCRISRYAMDVREFTQHLKLESAAYCGWSMGAAVMWSYVDLFGTKGIEKAIFVDQPISIYAHANWAEKERLEAGGMTSAPERMIDLFTQGTPASSLIADIRVMERAMAKDSPYFVNSGAFAAEFIKNGPKEAAPVLFDHITNDWRDVVSRKINVPTAIFTGDYSNNVPSQRWLHSVIPGSQLYIYSKEDQGDHFLMFKNPVRFVSDLTAFIEK